MLNRNEFVSFLYSQTYIPLQSFNVERPKDLPLHTSSKGSRKHGHDVLEKYSKPYDLPVSSGHQIHYPVLKIEEDFDDISMTNGTCKSISTQTSPINEMNSNRINKKVGSSNSLWTSDESILRGAEEDIKSSSSSCEETGGVMSSNKSGKKKFYKKCKKKKIFEKNSLISLYIILFTQNRFVSFSI